MALVGFILVSPQHAALPSSFHWIDSFTSCVNDTATNIHPNKSLTYRVNTLKAVPLNEGTAEKRNYAPLRQGYS